MGSVELSSSGNEVVIEIPGEEGGRFRAALKQVLNMLDCKCYLIPDQRFITPRDILFNHPI